MLAAWKDTQRQAKRVYATRSGDLGVSWRATNARHMEAGIKSGTADPESDER